MPWVKITKFCENCQNSITLPNHLLIKKFQTQCLNLRDIRIKQQCVWNTLTRGEENGYCGYRRYQTNHFWLDNLSYDGMCKLDILSSKMDVLYNELDTLSCQLANLSNKSANLSSLSNEFDGWTVCPNILVAVMLVGKFVQ